MVGREYTSYTQRIKDRIHETVIEEPEPEEEDSDDESEEPEELSPLSSLMGAAVAIVALAIATVTGIIVLIGIKDSGTTGLSPEGNQTIDMFISGLAIFGSFIGVIILAVIGKLIITMFGNTIK